MSSMERDAALFENGDEFEAGAMMIENLSVQVTLRSVGKNRRRRSDKNKSFNKPASTLGHEAWRTSHPRARQ